MNLRSCICTWLSVSLFLSTPAPLFAAPANESAPAPSEVELSPEQIAATTNDMQMLYWGQMQEENPLLAEFALGEPVSDGPLWQVEGNDPLLDSDPFFMRSQQWQPATASMDASEDCQRAVCARKENGGVSFLYDGRVLTLNRPLSPIFETDDHILLSANDMSLFEAKVPGDASPGEGLFFINKNDFARAAKFDQGVPVYFFPLPGPGWTGPNNNAFENDVARQVVIYNRDGFGLPIDRTDLETMEHVEFQNLVIGQTWSVLNGDVPANGAALPMPNVTLSFGMFLSGQMPAERHEIAANTNSKAAAIGKIASALQNAIIPSATARGISITAWQRLTSAYRERVLQLEEEQRIGNPEQLSLPMDMPETAPAPQAGLFKRTIGWAKQKFSQLRTAVSDRKERNAAKSAQPELDLQKPAQPEDPNKRPAWRRWLAPGIMYGTKFGIAAAVAPQIDWSGLITADMPQRIMAVSGLFGAVLAASVALKYTIHKAIFDKKYPKTADETVLERINKEHKGILDEYTHGLWAATAGIPQGIRHCLDFLKDRFLPANKIVHSAWEKTMGFQMRASSLLAMNWKKFSLGSIVFGMADSIQVMVDMLIFGPMLIHAFGGTLGGATTAAFVSATILSQFVGYLREGAHSYSADVKMIHMKSAEDEAKRKMRAEGIDPESPKNDGQRNRLTAEELEKRYKMVGLPGKDEFLYDPITVLEGMTKRSGYSVPDELSDADKKRLASRDFVLTHRRWGLIKPALKRALIAARAAQEKAPTQTGAQVIELLEWASNNRGNFAAIANRGWDVLGSRWGSEGLIDAMTKAQREALAKDKNPTGYKAMKAAIYGGFRYLASDSTQEARDIRATLFLMSTSGSPNDVAKYLPQSWRAKAGSEVAAQVGAELFHRAFYSYMDFDQNKIIPTQELEAEYGGRVRAIMERIDRRNPDLLGDAFTRQIRYWELMARLQEKDKVRKEVMSYDPQGQAEVSAAPQAGGLKSALSFVPKLFTAYERKQWDIAREEAAKRFTDPVDAENQVAREWMGIAEHYRVVTDDGSQRELDMADWARTYKYRTIVAQEIAKRVGLYVDDPAQSELVRKVIVSAAVATESQLATPKESFYVSRLGSEDKRFYEAEVFSRHFINGYINTAVRSDVEEGDGVPATSPEFPGRFQKIRRALVGRPGGRAASAVLRTFESVFRAEETSYSPTIWGWLDRNLPLIPDMTHNFIRLLRFMPYAFVIGWPTSYYIWQLHIPYVMYVVTFALAFIHPTLVELNNRLMRSHDIKPMDDVPSKLTYAFIHSTLTNPQVVVEAAFTQTIQNSVDKNVIGPVKELIEDCQSLLTTGKHTPGH